MALTAVNLNYQTLPGEEFSGIFRNIPVLFYLYQRDSLSIASSTVVQKKNKWQKYLLSSSFWSLIKKLDFEFINKVKPYFYRLCSVSEKCLELGLVFIDSSKQRPKPSAIDGAKQGLV